MDYERKFLLWLSHNFSDLKEAEHKEYTNLAEKYDTSNITVVPNGFKKLEPRKPVTRKFITFFGVFIVAMK